MTPDLPSDQWNWPAEGSVWEHWNGMQRFRVERVEPPEVEVVMLADTPDTPAGRRFCVEDPPNAFRFCRLETDEEEVDA